MCLYHKQYKCGEARSSHKYMNLSLMFLEEFELGSVDTDRVDIDSALLYKEIEMSLPDIQCRILLVQFCFLV